MWPTRHHSGTTRRDTNAERHTAQEGTQGRQTRVTALRPCAHTAMAMHPQHHSQHTRRSLREQADPCSMPRDMHFPESGARESGAVVLKWRIDPSVSESVATTREREHRRCARV